MVEGIILYRHGSFYTDGESCIENGILRLENDKTRLISAESFACLDSLKVAGDQSSGKSRLAVYCNYDDLESVVRYISDNGSSIREYMLYGEHNKDLLAEDFVRCSTPMTLSVNDSGGLRITYDDGN